MMVDLSDHEWQMRTEWGEIVGKPPPERNRGWSNLQKGRLRERIRDCEEDHERNRAGRASRERSRWHHELRWEKDADWRAAHDAECGDCRGHRATSFGLDDFAMRQVRAPAHPDIASKPSQSRPATRPNGDGKEAGPAGNNRPPPPPSAGERERLRQPDSYRTPRGSNGGAAAQAPPRDWFEGRSFTSSPASRIGGARSHAMRQTSAPASARWTSSGALTSAMTQCSTGSLWKLDTGTSRPQ